MPRNRTSKFGNDSKDASSLASQLAESATQITDRIISAKDKQFGAKGDGVTDDTTALQNFINYVISNHYIGIIPSGTYKITATLNVPSGFQWTIQGGGFGQTVLKQYTDNIPILNMGYDGVNQCHSVRLTDLEFQYANAQTSANTNGNAIFFNSTYYESEFKRLRFSGWYGIKLKSGSVPFWGCTLDQLVFTVAIYGGAMDWNGTVNAIPNNKFGRMFMDCLNMAGPIFNQLRGYNFIIDNLEFLRPTNAQLMSFNAGAICTIGAIKVEAGTYNTSVNLMQMATGSKVKIGQFWIGGSPMVMNPASGNVYLLQTNSGGATGWLEIDQMDLSATTFGGNVYILEGATGSMIIKNLTKDANNWQLTNIGSSTCAETACVESWNNGRLSANKGDADYTITLGDPNIISYETTLTASRTVNLPNSNSMLFNGLRYRIRSYGAVNGTNFINVVCGGFTKATLSTDKTVVEMVYRRNAANAQGGWIVVGYNTLP